MVTAFKFQKKKLKTLNNITVFAARKKIQHLFQNGKQKGKKMIVTQLKLTLMTGNQEKEKREVKTKMIKK